MTTLADMTPEERAHCRGMWGDVETPVGTEMAIYDQSRWGQEPTLFEPGYGHFEADFSKATPRFDLPRAWNPDGTPPAWKWEHAHIPALGEFTRRFVGEWEEA